MKKGIAGGTVHKLPLDLRGVLASSPALVSAWNNLTPLARNEWICWVEAAVKAQTRTHRIERTRTELSEGKRRPCCWAGCIHRRKDRNRRAAADFSTAEKKLIYTRDAKTIKRNDIF